MCSTLVFSVTGPVGSLSPAGSSGPSLTSTLFTSPSSTTSTKRLHLMVPSASLGPGCSMDMPIFLVNWHLVSARKRTIEPSTF